MTHFIRIYNYVSQETNGMWLVAWVFMELQCCVSWSKRLSYWRVFHYYYPKNQNFILDNKVHIIYTYLSVLLGNVSQYEIVDILLLLFVRFRSLHYKICLDNILRYSVLFLSLREHVPNKQFGSTINIGTVSKRDIDAAKASKTFLIIKLLCTCFTHHNRVDIFVADCIQWSTFLWRIIFLLHWIRDKIKFYY